jgi:hypothetical protein
MNHTASRPLEVRAKAIGDGLIEAVEGCVNDDNWTPMAPLPGAASPWQASTLPSEPVTVRAWDMCGRTDEDAVEPAAPGWSPGSRRADGGDRIGAWPGKAVLNSQPGADRNGRTW